MRIEVVAILLAIAMVFAFTSGRKTGFNSGVEYALTQSAVYVEDVPEGHIINIELGGEVWQHTAD